MLTSVQDYRAFRFNQKLPDRFCNEYWGRVKETLHSVFGKDESLADHARLKLDEVEAEKGPQTLFYHASPLEIAAHLAGVAQILPEQKAAYFELQLIWNLAPPREDAEGDTKSVRNEHLGVLHPEA